MSDWHEAIRDCSDLTVEATLWLPEPPPGTTYVLESPAAQSVMEPLHTAYPRNPEGRDLE